MKNNIALRSVLFALVTTLSSMPSSAGKPVNETETATMFQDSDYSVVLPSCVKKSLDDAKKVQEALGGWATYLYWVDLNADGMCDLITMQDSFNGPESRGIPVYLVSAMCFRYYNPATDAFDIAKIKNGCGGEMFVGGPALTLYYNKTAHRVEVANPPWFYEGPEEPYRHDSPLAWFHFRMMLRATLLIRRDLPKLRYYSFSAEVEEMWNGPTNPNFPRVIFADIYPKRWVGYARIPGLREKALKIQAEEVERIGGNLVLVETTH